MKTLILFSSILAASLALHGNALAAPPMVGIPQTVRGIAQFFGDEKAVANLFKAIPEISAGMSEAEVASLTKTLEGMRGLTSGAEKYFWMQTADTSLEGRLVMNELMALDDSLLRRIAKAMSVRVWPNTERYGSVAALDTLVPNPARFAEFLESFRGSELMGGAKGAAYQNVLASAFSLTTSAMNRLIRAHEVVLAGGRRVPNPERSISPELLDRLEKLHRSIQEYIHQRFVSEASRQGLGRPGSPRLGGPRPGEALHLESPLTTAERMRDLSQFGVFRGELELAATSIRSLVDARLGSIQQTQQVLKAHGTSPWETIAESLIERALSARISPPGGVGGGSNYGPYHAHLRDLEAVVRMARNFGINEAQIGEWAAVQRLSSHSGRQLTEAGAMSDVREAIHQALSPENRRLDFVVTPQTRNHARAGWASDILESCFRRFEANLPRSRGEAAPEVSSVLDTFGDHDRAEWEIVRGLLTLIYREDRAAAAGVTEVFRGSRNQLRSDFYGHLNATGGPGTNEMGLPVDRVRGYNDFHRAQMSETQITEETIRDLDRIRSGLEQRILAELPELRTSDVRLNLFIRDAALMDRIVETLTGTPGAQTFMARLTERVGRIEAMGARRIAQERLAQRRDLVAQLEPISHILR